MEETCKDPPQGLENFNPRTENLSVKTVSTTTVSSSIDSQTPPTSWIERVNHLLLFYSYFIAGIIFLVAQAHPSQTLPIVVF